MTSNLGSKILLDCIEQKGEITADAKNDVINKLRNYFKPEFLNRIDETIVFNPLVKEQMYEIAALMMKELKDRLLENKLSLKVEPEIINWIAESAYDPIYGARPIQRYIMQKIETPLARYMIANRIEENVLIYVMLKNDQPVFEHEKIHSLTV